MVCKKTKQIIEYSSLIFLKSHKHIEIFVKLAHPALATTNLISILIKLIEYQ